MCIVICAYEFNNFLPSFGLIKHIFITYINLPLAICQLNNTNYFDEHYQTFNETHTTKYICINLEQLNQRSYKVHTPLLVKLKTCR